MPARLPERVEAVLVRILGPLRDISALESGTSGESHLIETANGRFVAKRFAPGSLELLGPGEQYALLEVLADSGLAPRPAGYDADTRLLVTEFLEASPVSRDRLTRPDTIATIAEGLEKLHAVEVDIPRFVPVDHAGRYVGEIGGREALPPLDRQRYDELRDLAGLLEGLPGRLCHNDLAIGNMLFDGGLRLVDFDYAAIAPAVVDLASLTTLNEFSEKETALLLGACPAGETPFPVPEFARVERLMRLVAHFWSLASADPGAAIVAKYRIREDLKI
jgi:aminoglycoside phosphotransferase (APT) family kinase protein